MMGKSETRGAGNRAPGRRWSRRKGVIGTVAAMSAVAMVATGCGSGSSGGGGDTITIGYISWAEDVALTNLFQQQLEDKGYNVEMTQLDAGPLFSGMAQGDVDMFLDTWLPTTHASYWEQYGDQLEDLGVWYDNASLELAVPAYVDNVNSIADLKDHADEFDGKITGIEPGAGIMARAEDHAIPDYDLEGTMTVQQSSETAMLSELDSAIKDQQPLVITAWHPHWMYDKYELKDLEDPEGSMGQAEQLHITARDGFSADHPEIAELASTFTIDDAHLESLENAIQGADKGQESEAVKTWSEENQDYIDEQFAGLPQKS